MKEEIQKILSLLEEGKISKEQAGQLIDALNHSQDQKASTSNNEKARKFKVHISDENHHNINLNLPISWVSFGLKFVSDHDQFICIGGKSIPIDKKLLMEAITNPNYRGTLVDIQQDDSHIQVVVE
ncbi:MAG TPA: hypothetical protein PK581_07850 [Caldisericia bacterium]|jgi:hypothetical protein|nr:hypothetical protein [Caldisericia bacterium]